MRIRLLFIFLAISLYFPSNVYNTNVLCNQCKRVESGIISFLKNNMKNIQKISQIICDLILPNYVCHYFTDELGLLLIQKNFDFFLDTSYFCSIKFNICESEFELFSIVEFKDYIYDNFPQQKKIINKGNEFSALVFSDVHIQIDYLYNSKVECSDPASCCFQPSFNPFSEEKKAGYWGTPGSNCDIPQRLFEKTLEDMKRKSQNEDFVFILGDNYGHNYFRDKSSDSLIQTNKYFYQKVAETFKDKIIIPVLGNHESHPVNYYEFQEQKNFVNENILPNFLNFVEQSKIDDLINNGFFELQYDDRNIKIISISPFLAMIQNASLAYKNTDILQFLEKISKSLYESEQIGQKVILLSHIPLITSDNFEEFEAAMRIIFIRFESTIQSIISAHTHKSEMKMLYNDLKKVQLINFIVPSVTTLSNYYPSYTIFEFNRIGYVENFYQFRLDLDYYNQFTSDVQNLEYNLFHNFRKDYGIVNWGPENYTNFVNELIESKEKQLLYYKQRKGYDFKPDEPTLEFEKCNFYYSYQNEITLCQERVSGKKEIYDNLFKFFFQHPWLISKNQWFKKQLNFH